MRICILNQFYAPDMAPTAHLAAGLAEHRAAAGDEVTVVAGAGEYTGTAPAAPRPAVPGLRLIRLWNPSLGKRTIVRRVVDYLALWIGAFVRVVTLPRQDVIVVLTTPPFLYVVALAHKLVHPRTKVVLWSMDCYPDVAERYGKVREGGALSRLLRWINRRGYPRLDRVVVLDGAMEDLLASQYGTGDRPRFEVVPNYERLDLFPLPEHLAGQEAEPVGRPADDAPFVVLYQGNLGYGHRYDTVLDAAERLGDRVAFRFVGGGIRYPDLEADRTARGLTNVTQAPYVPKQETPRLLAEADAALITLDDRALGVMSPSKLHSCLAAGLPIVYVGPPGSNVDEAIVAYDCGVSLRHGDVDGLVEAIERWRSGDRRAAGLRSRQAFEDAYNDQAVLPRFDRILSSL